MTLKICPNDYFVTVERGPSDWQIFLVYATGSRELVGCHGVFPEAFAIAAKIVRTAQIPLVLDFGAAMRAAGLVEKNGGAK